MLVSLLGLVFPIALIAAMVSDVRRYLIPNELSLALVAGYLAVVVASGAGWHSLLWSSGLALVVFLVGMVLFFLRALGGGDVKLIAACALWTGPEMLPQFLLYLVMLGGLLALLLLVCHRLRLAGTLTGWTWIRVFPNGKPKVPYAVAIGAAGLIVYPSLPLLAGAMGGFLR